MKLKRKQFSIKKTIPNSVDGYGKKQLQFLTLGLARRRLRLLQPLPTASLGASYETFF